MKNIMTTQDIAGLRKLAIDLRIALRDADKVSTYNHCLGCGHERDEIHKADCLIYPGMEGNQT